MSNSDFEKTTTNKCKDTKAEKAAAVPPWDDVVPRLSQRLFSFFAR